MTLTKNEIKNASKEELILLFNQNLYDVINYVSLQINENFYKHQGVSYNRVNSAFTVIQEDSRIKIRG